MAEAVGAKPGAVSRETGFSQDRNYIFRQFCQLSGQAPNDLFVGGLREFRPYCAMIRQGRVDGHCQHLELVARVVVGRALIEARKVGFHV